MPIVCRLEIAGGLMAAVLAARLSYLVALAASTLVFILLIAWFTGTSAPTMMMAGFWRVRLYLNDRGAIPVSACRRRRPSRSTPALLSPAQLLGCGAGPLVAALGMQGDGIGVTEWIVAALAAAFLLMFYLSLGAAGIAGRPAIRASTENEPAVSR